MAYKTTSASAPKSTGHKVTGVSIDKTDNGGYVVREHCEPEVKSGRNGGAIAYMRPKEYAFGDSKQLNAYLKEQFGA